MVPQGSNQQGTSLVPSERTKRIAKKLLELNTLVAFPIDGPEILEWARELDRLMSYDELEKLPFILDSFKRGDLPFDANQGIRNIFHATKQVRKTETGFEILRAIW